MSFQKKFPSIQHQESVKQRLKITDPDAAHTVEYLQAAVAMSLEMAKSITMAVTLAEMGKSSWETASKTIKDELTTYAMFSALQMMNDPNSREEMKEHMKTIGHPEINEHLEELRKMAEEHFEDEESVD